MLCGHRRRLDDCLVLVAAMLSIADRDFVVRAVPKVDYPRRRSSDCPCDPDALLDRDLVLRTLRLNCLTDAYADLWAERG